VSYRPFSKEHSGLFKLFSQLRPTKEGVLAFANSYGLLGYPVAVNFWNDKVASSPPPLEAFNASPVSLQPLEIPNAPGGYVGELLSSPAPPLNGLWSWTGQIRALADFVRACGHLRREPALADAIQGTAFVHLRKTVGLSLSWSLRSRSFHLRHLPYSLIGALWLQAVRAVAEKTAFRECRVCRKPIEISRSGGARADAVFCSDKCKTRAYRQRVATARRIKRAGKLTEREIAIRLHTDRATLRGWLDPTKASGKRSG
jgi:hypothetical protein